MRASITLVVAASNLLLAGCCTAQCATNVHPKEMPVRSSHDIIAAFQQADSTTLNPSAPGAPNAAFLASVAVTHRIPTLTTQKTVTMVGHCDMLWADGLCAMKLVTAEDHDPVYSISSNAGETSPTRLRSMLVLFTAQRNEVREVMGSYTRKLNGTVVTNERTHLTKLRVGNRNDKGMSIFEQFRLATGRGFGSHLLHNVTQVPGASPGSLGRLEVLGKYAGIPGTWDIQYEADADNLVRGASFAREQEQKPFLTTTNAGIVECSGLKIAASGAYISHNYQASFRVLSLTNVTSADEAFTSRYKAVVEALDSPLAADSVVLDERGPMTKTALK
jgi:hypothetical protein